MKKFLSVVLALAMVLALAACNNNPNPTKPATDNPTNAATEKPLAGTYDIKVWVADAAVELTKTQIANYNASNEDGIVINATIEPVGEGDAATNMITDVEAGGDIFCFAQDQFARLVQAGALSQLGASAQEIVSKSNDAGVVAAASTSAGTMYAYPLTSDNGYFMYYDKSVIPDADVDSLEKLIEDCEKANKFFSMEVQTSAWYIAAWFFATGCVSEWETDADGAIVSVHDTFNSPEGLIAVKGMKKLVDSPMHLSSAGASEFSSGAAIVVSGTWAYNDVKAILGDNLGVTDLPSFTVDGKEYHLGSFNGCKLMGVKPQTDAKKSAALHKLAQYLTSETCQLERYDALNWGPSNSNAQKSDKVQSDPALAALLAQNQYSTPQGQIHGSWWDIGKVIGEDVKAAKDEAGLQYALTHYDETIKSLFTMTADEKNAWTVIGMYNSADGFFFTDYNNETRSNWGEDCPMTKDGDLWKTAAFDMPAGCEFKVRQGKSWDNAFPADNFKVEEAGKYIIVFNEATSEVSLEKAN